MFERIESICANNSKIWDPEISWETQSPTLSSCIIETFIVWIPAIFLWIFLPYLIIDCIRSKKPPINWNGYNILRLLVAIVWTVITFIDFILSLCRKFQWADNPSTSYIIATAIQFISRLAICFVLYGHRRAGVHCSGIVWFYLFFDTILGALSVATYATQDYRQTHEFALYCTEFSLTTLLLIICSFADRLPQNEYFIEVNGNVCPKEYVSFPSRLSFDWLTSLIIKGWRNPLTVHDLWAVRREDCTKNIFKYFNQYWKSDKYSDEEHKAMEKLDKSLTNGLVKESNKIGEKASSNIAIVVGKAFWAYFLPPCLIRLFTDCLQLANPMILKLLINFTSSTEPSWHGYIYALLFVFTNVFNSLVTSYQSQRMTVLGMRIKTCLISAVYRKALVLSNSAKKETTTGEIVNIMAVDCQRFSDLLPWLSFLYTAPIQMGIAVYLLYNEMGTAVFGGLALMILFLPINGVTAAKVKQYQMKQMKLKDKRLKTMNEILSGIKVLKLYAWEKAFTQMIQHIREQEIKFLRRSGWIFTIFICIASCTPLFVSLMTFGLYIVINDSVLDASKIFVSISLFNLLRIPLLMIPNMINGLVLTSVSVKRLNKFLDFPELSGYVKRSYSSSEMVSIDNGRFTWDTVDDVRNGAVPTLDNINLRVNDGMFVAIVGSVGSGKSSFLSALLGEMELVSGNVSIKGGTKIAYVPQQAWIQNATVKENILFGKPLDNKLYDQVIRSCALKQDLHQLSAGDATEIGEKGINLSGGQKQRVSLARAVYSDVDLYLLDDPLSAVDAHVGKHIMTEVLDTKTGVLKNKTRILVTNQLFVLPDVDLIVVLKDGKIGSIGTYDNLLHEDKDFAELVKEYSMNKTEEEVEDNEKEKSVVNRRKKTTTIVNNDANDDKKDMSKLVDSEKAEVGSVKITVYAKYAKSMSLFWTFVILFCYIVTNGCSSGSSFWLSKWGDHTGADQNAYYIGIYALIGFVQALTVSLGWVAIVTGTLLASKTLHQRLMNAMMHSPMSFFDTTPIGRIVNRFSKDIDILDTLMQMSLRILLNTTLSVLATIIIITIETPLFIAVFVPIFIIYYLIQKVYIITSRQLKRLESITRSPIYTHFSETINGVSTIRAYACSDRFIKESDKRVDNNMMCYYPNAIANCWLQVRLEVLANCLIFFAALFAVLARNSGDGMTAGSAGLSISYAMNITLALNMCVRMFAEVENNVVAVERIDEYSQVDREADWQTQCKVPDNWPDKGKVTFEGYGTRYREGLDLVLKGVDLNVKPGEKIGIVGRTGAGKSSLTLALFRIIESVFGKIVIDGIDISQMGLQDLRSRLTIIPQDPILFSGTIRSNLDPFEKSSDNDLWKALENSHLKSFVKSQDTELDYRVSEGGENLSVGQRQLICLARALLRHTAVLILDEATAAVDVETDALIQQTIRHEFKSCTVLTIAHRLNTIMDSDRVLVLHEGRVAEFDSPNNLLNDNQTIFYSLAKDAGLV
ncbi:multidrug resistance-associated protein 1-like isoform X1 [Oppia nitens]|uniref:multidrug resistance-associated protein 1-like isoform X1 n=1 Tax=Oppia nitens TaxID=1686743 RepID=UPI0023DA138B|nr:multidrug resistance-associated protein 1-like isoform X1 [Oppia nitens]